MIDDLHLRCACVLERSGTPIGSAFLVAPTVVLTAHHVVEGKECGLRFMRLREGSWTEVVVPAVTLARHGDCAVLQLTESLEDVPGMELSEQAPGEGAAWGSCGWPAQVDVAVRVEGRIQGLAPVPGRGGTLQLSCDQVAAGLHAPGLSGSPLVVDGHASGLLTAALIPSGGVTVGGILYALPPHDLRQALLRAASAASWTTSTFTLNHDGGRVELDPYELRVRPLENEAEQRIPLAALRRVWTVGVQTQGTVLQIEASGGRFAAMNCVAGVDLTKLLRALPAYVDMPAFVRGEPLRIERPKYCVDHKGTEHAHVAFELAGEPIFYGMSGDPLPDTFAVLVQAPEGCVTEIRRAVDRFGRPSHQWLALAASWSLLLAMAIGVYLSAFGATVSRVAMLVLALLLPVVVLLSRGALDAAVC